MRLVDASDEWQFAKKLCEDKAVEFILPQTDLNSSCIGIENLTHPAGQEIISAAFASTMRLSTLQPVKTSNAGKISTITSGPPNHHAHGQTELFYLPHTIQGLDRDFQEGDVLQVCDVEPESKHLVTDQNTGTRDEQ